MEFLEEQAKAAPADLFLTEESSRGSGSRIGLMRCVNSLPEEKISESSSSVVVSGESSENEEEEDGAVSSQGTWFGSSLEDSLPIKRGLSNHYIGKSKSFGNLMEASKSKDLEKVESSLNKRRRLLIAKKLRRRSSLSPFSIYSKTNNNLNSMPLLALQESDEEDSKCSSDNDNTDSSDDETRRLKEKRMKMTTNNRDFMVQTQSCFCLASFQDDDR